MVKKKRVAIVLIAVAGAGVSFSVWLNRARAGASPEQPLNFSHRAHVENKIDCSFCHQYYEKHDAAGIPPVSLCVTCHMGIPQDDPNTQKIFEYANQGREIPWVRLYQLPQYSVFTHKWHIRAGIDCSACHGDIGQSVRPVRHMQYEMAWCVDCHTERKVSIDCFTCHR